MNQNRFYRAMKMSLIVVAVLVGALITRTYDWRILAAAYAIATTAAIVVSPHGRRGADAAFMWAILAHYTAIGLMLLSAVKGLGFGAQRADATPESAMLFLAGAAFSAVSVIAALSGLAKSTSTKDEAGH